MITFKEFISESPTNVSSGLGIRGLGDVSGDPKGSLSNWAAQNAATPPPAQDLINQHLDLHTSTSSVSSGINSDTKDNIIHAGKVKAKIKANK